MLSSFKVWFDVGILRFQKWFVVDVLGFQIELCHRYFDLFWLGQLFGLFFEKNGNFLLIFWSPWLFLMAVRLSHSRTCRRKSYHRQVREEVVDDDGVGDGRRRSDGRKRDWVGADGRHRGDVGNRRYRGRPRRRGVESHKTLSFHRCCRRHKIS